MDSTQRTARTVGLVLFLIGIAGLLAATLAIATDVYLLIFLGVLLAVFLVHVSHLMMKWIPFNYHWNLGILLLSILGLAVGCLYFFGVSIENQLERTSRQLDNSSVEVRQWLDAHPHTLTAIGKIPFAERLLDVEPVGDESNQSDALMTELEGAILGDDPPPKQKESGKESGKENTDGKAADDPNDLQPQAQEITGTGSKNERPDNSTTKSEPGSSEAGSSESKVSEDSVIAASGRAYETLSSLFSTSFGLAVSFVLVLFVGIFIAIDPKLYWTGTVQLFPVEHRPRAEEVMKKMGATLFFWLNGTFASMAITGGGTAVGLWLIGVPMALMIGIVTALLTFVPNIGAIAALLLAILVAFPEGPMTVLWVIILYASLQAVESNIITPLIQQKQTSIPPALLISFQLLMGVTTGFLGVLVATPLLAATLVVIKEVWIKGVLGDADVDTPEVETG